MSNDDYLVPMLLGSILIGSVMYCLSRRWMIWRRSGNRELLGLKLTARGADACQLIRDLLVNSKSETVLTKLNLQGPQIRKFICTSLTLVDSFRQVIQITDDPPLRLYGFKESFHYLTGVRIDASTFVLSDIVKVQFAEQSAVGVRVADSSNLAALSRLDDSGLILLAHAHSHPGHGRNANRPSMTDKQFQSRLERGGHVAIGVIFTRDGFVRFFAGENTGFQIEVIGNDVEKLDDNEYRIRLADGTV